MPRPVESELVISIRAASVPVRCSGENEACPSHTTYGKTAWHDQIAIDHPRTLWNRDDGRCLVQLEETEFVDIGVA